MKELKEIIQGSAVIGMMASVIICLVNGWFEMAIIMIGFFAIFYLLSLIIKDKDNGN